MEYIGDSTWRRTIGPKIWENITPVLVSVLLVVLLTLYYKYIVLPANWVKDFRNVNTFDRLRQMDRCSLFAQSASKRGVEDMPPVYPNGWFALLESRMLKTGQSTSVSALGREFAVFRGEDRKAYVFDAFCPHLGASFSSGATVSGNCLECPFHGWLFRGTDGKCVKIPYIESVPDFVRVKSWPVSEGNGFIFLWYNSENEDPTWTIPEIVEINDKKWKYMGRTEHIVNCHIQDIAENGADTFHLNQIHTDSFLLGSVIDQRRGPPFLKWLQHEWNDATWEPSGPPKQHIATITISHKFKLLGYCLDFMTLSLNIQQVGPAAVLLHFDSPLGKGMFIQCVTPQGPLEQRLIHHLYTNPSFPNIAAKIYIAGQAIMVERDIMIWNKKKYLKAPMLMKEERRIARFRKWYSQFYAANSPTIQSLRNESLSW